MRFVLEKAIAIIGSLHRAADAASIEGSTTARSHVDSRFARNVEHIAMRVMDTGTGSPRLTRRRVG